MVAEAAHVPLARNKALIGEDLFACETGLHLQGLAKAPALFEPFAPEQIGALRKVAVGLKSGKAAVRGVMTRQGIQVQEPDIHGLTSKVRALSRSLERPLHDHELRELAATWFSSNKRLSRDGPGSSLMSY